jgi:hypothetical protein
MPRRASVVQGPETRRLLAVEIEFGGVLDAQHHRMGAHALLRARPVRRQDVAPIHVRIAKKAVGRDGFAPAIARRRDGRFGIRRKSFHEYLCPLVETTVSKVESGKLVIGPPLRYLGHFRRPK